MAANLNNRDHSAILEGIIDGGSRAEGVVLAAAIGAARRRRRRQNGLSLAFVMLAMLPLFWLGLRRDPGVMGDGQADVAASSPRELVVRTAPASGSIRVVTSISAGSEHGSVLRVRTGDVSSPNWAVKTISDEELLALAGREGGGGGGALVYRPDGVQFVATASEARPLVQ